MKNVGNSVRKILTMTKLLMALMVAFCYIGLKLGYNGLFLVGEINLPYPVYGIIKYLLFYAQITMIACIILNIYEKRIFKVIWPYYIVHFVISPFVGSNLLTSFVMPVLYIMLVGTWWTKDVWYSFKRLLKFTIPFGIFNILILIIKIGDFYFNYNILPQFQYLVQSIDLMVVVIIYFAIGGAKYYEFLGVAVRRPGKFSVFPEDCETPYHDGEDREAIKEFESLVGFERLVAMSMFIGFQIFQWALIVGVCVGVDHLIGLVFGIYFNVFIKVMIISTSFVAHGMIIKRRWRGATWLCSLVCSGMFFISSIVTVSFAYSQFFPIIVGLALVYAMYRLDITLKNRIISESQRQIEQIDKLSVETAEILNSVDDIY